MFGVIGDPHIISREYVTTRWLREKVSKLSKLDLDFVLVCGDISHHGRIDELQLAKEILDELPVPYYCCHGNHDYVSDGGAGLALTTFHDIFGPSQFTVQIGDYNLLVLHMRKWKEIPLKIKAELPAIALIHTASKTSQNIMFPRFDNPELEDFLRSYGVRAVFQGHIHSDQAMFHHGGIQYINCSNRFGLGCLEDSVLYVPVITTIDEAYSTLDSIKKKRNDEYGENE